MGNYSGTMSESSKREYFESARSRYGRRNRKGKSRLLDELCETLDWDRKHAIKSLNGRINRHGRRGRSGRKKKYDSLIGTVVTAIWKASEQPCSIRLKEQLAVWLPCYEKRNGKLATEDKAKVLSASARTLERLLSGQKAESSSRYNRKGGRTSHALKKSIEIRCGRWEVDGPGWLEADTVSHGGGITHGDYLWSLTMVDIHTGWTELRASWNCGAYNICTAIEEIEKALPFEIQGFDCDNGPEFLNHHLESYLRGKEGIKRRGRPIKWTRCRPYRKNDQAHVEQKNFTHVRQLLGYDRYDDPRLVKAVNQLYKEAWIPLKNYFCPVMKLIEKERRGGKFKKIYDTPATPCQRLLDSDKTPESVKQSLENQREQLDPFQLSESVELHLKKIERLRRKIAKERGVSDQSTKSQEPGRESPHCGGESAPVRSASADLTSAASPPQTNRKTLPKGTKTKRKTKTSVSLKPALKKAA